MITVISLLAARDSMSRADFIDYYENHHVPLVLGLAPAPDYYVRNYLPAQSDRRSEADFDVMTHLRFADEETYRRWLSAVLADDSGVAQDEARFLDRSRTRSWIVEERSAPGEGRRPT